MSGYSGTPLLQKLGYKQAMKCLVANPPPEYAEWLGELPVGFELVVDAAPPIQAAHLFLTERAALQTELAGLRPRLGPSGFVWISWPKKASRVPTDITEDVIRDVALPMGYVDIKVCAVSDVWSGLKLVIRKSERTPVIP